MPLADAHAHIFASGLTGPYNRPSAGADDLYMYDSFRQAHHIDVALIVGFEGLAECAGNNDRPAAPEGKQVPRGPPPSRRGSRLAGGDGPSVAGRCPCRGRPKGHRGSVRLPWRVISGGGKIRMVRGAMQSGAVTGDGARAVPPLATTLIGSYPQPEWLIDRERLRSSLPARVRDAELWRIPAPYLRQAQDDATALAIRDFERAGIDILTDGEIRRESYSNRFATALEGMDIDSPAMVPGRTGVLNPVPRVVGPVRRTRPVEVADTRFLRAETDRLIKITLPGPFTMSQQAHNEAYPDAASLAMDLAAAVNEELHDLFAAGADVVQLDEPWLQARAEEAREYALPVIDRALQGAPGTTALHTCFGYAHVVTERPAGYPFLAELADCAADQLAIEAAQPRLDPSVLAPIAGKTIILGVLDLSDDGGVETPEQVAGRIERALEVVPAERLQVAPDCGMKYLARATAFAKLRAMVEGTGIVRAELAS
jgi:5-methyltetrahydropteroyltriglutamate--homocysteine methyltransferase